MNSEKSCGLSSVAVPPGCGQEKSGVAVGEGVAVVVGVWVGGIEVGVAGSGVGLGVSVGDTAVSVGTIVAVGSWETAVSSPALHPIKQTNRQTMSNWALFFILSPLQTRKL